MHRAFMFLLVLVGALVFALPASACEVCAEYFDWQSLDWCPYCSTVYCGYFTCAVRQSTAWGAYCTGEHAGCFEYGGNCSSEPDIHEPARRQGPHAMNSTPSPAGRLEDQWRLARVRVYKPRPAASQG
jgi:hypothetical protein